MDQKFLSDSSRTKKVFKVLLAISCLAYLVILAGLFKGLLAGSGGPEELSVETAFLELNNGGREQILRITGTGFEENIRGSLRYDVDNHAAIIGSFKTWSHLNQVVVRGDQAFLATQHRGLQILDVINPAKPRIIGTVHTPGIAWGVCLDGDYAYVADGTVGLQVISIIDPLRPHIVGSINTSSPAYAVGKLGKIILVAGDGRISAIDTNIPENPVILDTFAVKGRARGMAVSGGRIFLANGMEGVKILSFDPRSGFQLVESLPVHGIAETISISEKWLLVGCGQKGLELFSLDDPNPEFLLAIDTPGYAMGISVFEERIFVADNRHGLQILEGSPDKGFKIVNNVNTPGNARHVTVDKGFAFVADGNSGLQVIKGNLPAERVLPGLQTKGSVWDIATNGDQLFLADGPAGILVAKIEPSGELRSATAIEAPGGYVQKVAIADDRLYVAGGKGGLLIVDISKERPFVKEVIQMPDGSGVHAVAIDKDLVCVASGKKGLVILRINETEGLKIVGRLSGLGNVKDIAMVGRQAFLAAGKRGLLHVSLENPEKPVLVGPVALPHHLTLFANATAVSVTGDKLLLANSRAGCQVFDIQEPGLPRFVSTLVAMGNVTWVKGMDGKAYIFDSESGLQVVDLKAADHPRIIGSLGGSRHAGSVAIVNDKAYVALKRGGVKALPMPVNLPKMTIKSSREMILQVPPSMPPGNYFLTLNKGGETAVLDKVIHFSCRGAIGTGEMNRLKVILQSCPNLPTDLVIIGITDGGLFVQQVVGLQAE